MQTGTTFNFSLQIGTMFNGDLDNALLFSADAGQCFNTGWDSVFYNNTLSQLPVLLLSADWDNV